MIIKKYKAVLLIGIGILLSILYFRLFFQEGILFENSFLKLNKSERGFEYSGSVYAERVNISVDDMERTNTKEVSYKIGERYNKTFLVNTLNKTNYSTDITIYENNTLLFEGSYRKSSDSYIYLWDKDGDPVFGDIRIQYNNQLVFDEAYQVSNSHIAATALKDNIINRGNWTLFIFAIILLIVTIIDIKWPMFFFTLKHFMSVNNPEPSDLYIGIQRITWVVYPTVSFGLLVASLIVH